MTTSMYFFSSTRRPTRSTLFPYTTLFRSNKQLLVIRVVSVSYVGKMDIIATLVLRINELYLITRSEEHTSELQSHSDLVCRLLLEKKKSEGARIVGIDSREVSIEETRFLK